jgi:gluconolactonase
MFAFSRRVLVGGSLGLSLLVSPALAQEPAKPAAQKSPEAAAAEAVAPPAKVIAAPIVAPGATVKPEGIVAFLEGPAWHPNGSVFFTDVENNRIMRRDVSGKFQIFRTPSGKANGLVFDADRRLIACEGAGEGGNRRVTRTETNGVVTVLTDRYKGKRYNAPNDVTLDSRGRIYFTDPRYGDRDGLEMFDEKGNPIFGVYRIDDDGKVERILSYEVACPNGIDVSPGDKYLYVVDNDNSKPDGNRKVWRFELTPEGTVVPKTQTLLYDFGRGRGGDGMAIDVEGRLYVAAGTNVAAPPKETADNKAGVYVLSPEGKLLEFIPVLEDMVTNCTFGGPDLKTLYITAGHKLWSIPVGTPGYLPYPRKIKQ